MEKEQDLIKVCKLWYVTRMSTQGMMISKDDASALTAFDTLIQDLIEKHDIS